MLNVKGKSCAGHSGAGGSGRPLEELILVVGKFIHLIYADACGRTHANYPDRFSPPGRLFFPRINDQGLGRVYGQFLSTTQHGLPSGSEKPPNQKSPFLSNEGPFVMEAPVFCR